MKKENLENQYYKDLIKDFFFKYGLRFIVISVIEIIILVSYAWCYNFGAVAIMNGSCIAGFVGAIVSGLSFVTNHGFFDIFAYNGIRFINFVKQYKCKNFYGTYEYTKSKEFKRRENRLIPLSYLSSAVVFFIIYFIYYLVLFF